MSGLERRVAYLEKLVEELASLAVDQGVIIKRLAGAEFLQPEFLNETRKVNAGGFATSLAIIERRAELRRRMVGT